MGTSTITMVALAFALALSRPLPTAAASCASSTPASAELGFTDHEGPDDSPPPKPPQPEDAYFCCDSLNSQGKGSGNGCEQILHTVVAGCAKVLHCTDGYTNDEGKVTCTG
jgi:hypothetical protein